MATLNGHFSIALILEIKYTRHPFYQKGFHLFGLLHGKEKKQSANGGAGGTSLERSVLCHFVYLSHDPNCFCTHTHTLIYIFFPFFYFEVLKPCWEYECESV